ncbi:hypothetical protein [Dysgonomonas sp. 216]|uniref:hypothetical protein n=1 Tax=Dysgonomonas sp. 216 TaxID=2302934 RepID=UPI0013D5FC91|nr:hypothetical protein [Dysgonomonas sp. 216]
MKKIIVILIISVFIFACSSMRTVDMGKLRIGMTRTEVQNLIGIPDRVLHAGASDGGYEEVLQYTTYQGEIYAVTFWNDHLESYSFLDQTYPVGGVTPVPPVYYPTPRPPANPTPRPPANEKPSTRPPTNGSGSRPGAGNSGSGSTGRPTIRPSEPEAKPTTRPAQNSGSGSTTNTGRGDSGGGASGRATRTSTNNGE